MKKHINKILLAPDKFKYSLSSYQFCKIVKGIINSIDKKIKVISCPISDGGEGSLEVFKHIYDVKIVKKFYHDANFKRRLSSFAISSNVAFIELAQTSGLAITRIKNPGITTTFGMGEQIRDAIKKGATTIYLSIGGSSTNDAGCGMACALGYKFIDADGKQFIPTGQTLSKITKIIKPKQSFDKINFVTLCDVKNVLFGKYGAAYVYARQKGADDKKIKLLDDNLKYFNTLCKKLGYDFTEVKGGGSAGGMGAGTVFFLSSKLQSGAEYIFEINNINKKIQEADLIVSGEGKIDNQSMFGKVLSLLIEKAGKKPIVFFCGESDIEQGKYDIVEINNKSKKIQDNIKNTKKNLKRVAKMYFKNILAQEK